MADKDHLVKINQLKSKLHLLIKIDLNDEYGRMLRLDGAMFPIHEEAKTKILKIKKITEKILQFTDEDMLNVELFLIDETSRLIEILYSDLSTIKNSRPHSLATFTPELNEAITKFIETNLIVQQHLEKIQFSLYVNNITKFDDAAKSRLDDISNTTSKIDALYGEAKNAVDNTVVLSVVQAGKKQASFFSQSAEKYKTASRWWLGVIAAILVFIGILSFCFSPHLPDIFTTEKYKIIYFFITKFTLIGTLIYALFFAFKNHNANKHNSILNKHRADSLLTYKAILDVAGADKQDIILTQISDCMFKHQDTGFGKPDDSGLSSEQMINLFSKLIGKPSEPR